MNDSNGRPGLTADHNAEDRCTIPAIDTREVTKREVSDDQGEAHK